MQKHFKTSIVIFILMFSSSLLFSLSGGDQSLINEGMKPFNEALELLWSGQNAGIPELLYEAENFFKEISDPQEKLYYLSTIYLNRGRMNIAQDEKKSGQKNLKKSMELAEEALEYGDFSEGYRVWADAGSSYMVSKGLFTIIRTASRVQEYSDMAVKLDPGNSKAIIISALGKINAPKSAGGDPRKAVEMFESLLDNTDISQTETFQVYLYLSQSFDKLGEKENAEYWCTQASTIYPSNTMSIECRN